MGNNAALKVLIIDDDSDILQLLKYNLEKDGFRVRTVDDNLAAVSVARDFCPNLIILDIMMPAPNGISLCRLLRSDEQFRHTYIFFLSAVSDIHVQRAAFEAGGDDYIEKVMGLRALTHKIRAVLQGKFVIHKSETEVRVGHLTINRSTSSVKVHNHVYVLSKPEFELLFFLAQNRGKSFTMENLVNNIWGSEMFLHTTSVDSYLDNLQQKLGHTVAFRNGKNKYSLVLKNLTATDGDNDTRKVSKP